MEDLDMSSDEEDEILGNLRRGVAPPSTVDPYEGGPRSAATSAYGPKTTGASSSLDFAAMRDVFQEAGLDLDSAPTPQSELPTGASLVVGISKIGPTTLDFGRTDAYSSSGILGESSYDDDHRGPPGTAETGTTNEPYNPANESPYSPESRASDALASSDEYDRAQRSFDDGDGSEAAPAAPAPSSKKMISSFSSSTSDPDLASPDDDDDHHHPQKTGPPPTTSPALVEGRPKAGGRDESFPSEDSLRVDLKDAEPLSMNGSLMNGEGPGSTVTQEGIEEANVNFGTMRVEHDDATLLGTKSFSENHPARLGLGAPPKEEEEEEPLVVEISAAKAPYDAAPPSTLVTETPMTLAPETNASTVYSPPRVDESLDVRGVDLEKPKEEPTLTPAPAEDDPERWLSSKAPTTDQDHRGRRPPGFPDMPPSSNLRDESPPPPPPAQPKPGVPRTTTPEEEDMRASVAPPPPTEPRKPPNNKKNKNQTAPSSPPAAAPGAAATYDDQLAGELLRDNERLSASLGAAYERLAAREEAWEAERAALKREVATLKTENQFLAAGGERRPHADPATAHLRNELALEAERNALADELEEQKRAAALTERRLAADLEAARQQLDGLRSSHLRQQQQQQRLSAEAPPSVRWGEFRPDLDRLEALDGENAALKAKVEWHVENERLVDEQLAKVEEQSAELRHLRREVAKLPTRSETALRKRIAELEAKIHQLELTRRKGGIEPISELLKAQRPTRSVDVARRDAEKRCKDLEDELDEARSNHELRVRALRQEFEKLRAAHERRLRELRRENSTLVRASQQQQLHPPQPPDLRSSSAASSSKFSKYAASPQRRGGGGQMMMPSSPTAHAHGGPATTPARRQQQARDAARVAELEQQVAELALKADPLRIKTLEVEVERERELRRRTEAEREPAERALEHQVDALQRQLRDADVDRHTLQQTQHSLLGKLNDAQAELAQRPPALDLDRLDRERQHLQEALQDAQADLDAMRQTAKLAAADAASARRQLALTHPQTPTEVAVAALSAHVDGLERNASMRQQQLEAAVHDAKANARVELSRSDSRRREELAAKDAQIERFRTELDALLHALQIELARRNGPYHPPRPKQTTRQRVGQRA